MPRGIPKRIESERRAIESEEAKLKERRERLAEMEKAEVQNAFAKSALSLLPGNQIGEIGKALKRLGIEEFLKRLAD